MEIVVFCYRGSILLSVPIRCILPQERQHPNYYRRIHKMGEIHELFILSFSLVWFAGATPDRISWPFDSRKHPALASLNVTKWAMSPDLASTIVY